LNEQVTDDVAQTTKALKINYPDDYTMSTQAERLCLIF